MFSSFFFQIKSFSDFWSNTGNSFICNLNIQHEVPGIKSHHETLEYLSNLTPYSILFNRTVQQLRTKREVKSENFEQKNIKMFHTKINSHTYTQELLSKHVDDLQPPSQPSYRPPSSSSVIIEAVSTVTNSKANEKTKKSATTSSSIVSVPEARDDLVGSKSNKTATTLNSHENGHGSGSKYSGNIQQQQQQQQHHSRKVNTEKHLRKGKNHYRKEKHKNGQNTNSTRTHVRNEESTVYVSDFGSSSSSSIIGSRRGIIRTTPVKISHLILKSNRTGDCSQVTIYSWILILTYISFSVFLIEFLIVTESAVFTVAVVTAALPLIGIFWSLFELTNQGTSCK